jgi:multidrug efflux pump subunit AcrA (membrane-fusion protein)
MAGTMTWAGRLAALVVPVAAAAALTVAARGAATGPAGAEQASRVRPVRVIEIAPLPFVARATGHGLVTPARDWKAVARIEGAVAWMAPDLKDGGFAAEGAPLLRMDDADIRLALAQIDADLATLAIRAETYRSSLALAEREAALNEAEAQRQRELRNRGAAAQAAVDQAERAALASAQQAQVQRNLIAINAAEREALLARRAVAGRDLDHATIAAPFALRIGTVNVEVAQWVNRGTVLFEGDGTEAAEVAAEFPLGRLRPLVTAGTLDGSGGGVAADTGPLGLEAVVRLRAPGRTVEWPATVDRVAQAVGQRTQSASVIVRVAQNYASAEAGVRPPLRRGAFVEVELRAPVREVVGLLPAAALHQGAIYLLGADNRLEIRPVGVAVRMGETVIVEPAPAPGTRVVVSDLVPAVAGMALRPQPDADLAQRLADVAAGRRASLGE